MPEKFHADTRRLFFTITAAVIVGMITFEAASDSLAAVLLPFGIAYAAARLVRPVGVYLSKKARVNEKIGCAVWAVIICFAAGYAVINLSGMAWDKLGEVSEYLPEAAESAADMISNLSDKIRAHIPFLGGSDQIKLGGVVTEAFRETAVRLGASAADILKNTLSGFPGGIFSMFIGIVAFIYLTADMSGIGKSITSLIGGFFGEEKAGKISDAFAGFTDAFFAYLRSYLLLTLITFAELSAGFLIIGVDSPFAAAFAVAVIDALPLLGCGVVIIPWALWCFLSGNVRRGVMLVVLQIIIYAVRQFAEPKIIGQMTGVHPFVALAVLFAGLKIGGVTGMILAPILLIAVVGTVRRNSAEE